MANPLLPAGAVPLAASLIPTDTVMVEAGTQLRRANRAALLAFLDLEEAGAPVNAAPNGTVGQPGIAFGSDPDVGFWRPAPNTIEAVAGNTALWRASPAALTINRPVNGSAVQQSPADATAGRLLTVGAFGLGGNAPLVANADAATLPSGFYGYSAGEGSAGGPSGAIRGTLLHTSGADRDSQLMIVSRGDGYAVPGTIWTRSRSLEGVWRPWVSNSPHSNGSNGNGDWRRWADGRQQCSVSLDMGSRKAAGTGTYADPFRTAPRDWTFPVPFAEAPAYVSISPSVAAASDLARSMATTFRGTSQTGVVGLLATAVCSDAGGVSVYMHVVAEGRWAP